MAKNKNIENIENTVKKTFEVKKRKKVTGIPFLKINVAEPVYVKFTSLITSGLMKKKPAQFVNVINLETGEIAKLLLGTVLTRQLLDNYGDDGFLNKDFEIIKGEKVKGGDNEYYEYEINEIEI